MLTVYKYPLLPLSTGTSVRLALNSSVDHAPVFLYVGEQSNRPFVWVQIPDKDESGFGTYITNYEIHAFGTGAEIPLDFDGEYIGTVQLNKGIPTGEFVFHYYAVKVT